MKIKIIICAISLFSIIACKKNSTTSNSNSATNPPATTSFSSTQLMGTWYLDTIKAQQVTFGPHPTPNYTFTINFTTTNPVYSWSLTSTPSQTSGAGNYVVPNWYANCPLDTGLTAQNTSANATYNVNIDGNSKIIFSWNVYNSYWSVDNGYLEVGGNPEFKILSVDAHNLRLVSYYAGGSAQPYYYHLHK